MQNNQNLSEGKGRKNRIGIANPHTLIAVFFHILCL